MADAYRVCTESAEVLALVRAEHAANPAFAVQLQCDKRTFDVTLQSTWWEVFNTTPSTPVGSQCVDLHSTIDSANREADAERIVRKLHLLHPEHGSETARVLVGDALVSTGFLRVLYGDHGPYFELAQSQVHWSAFNRHVLKGPARHYHEHCAFTATGAVEIKLYDQFRGVEDEPNPPPGDFSVSNNRREGYAPYRAGVLYLSADDVTNVVF